MKGNRNGRHRRADSQARSHSDALAYYRARASQPKPAAAFDAEWAQLSRAERDARADTGRGELKGIDYGADQSFTTAIYNINPRSLWFLGPFPPGSAVTIGGGVITTTQIKSDREIENAGLRVGEIIAHRVWRIDESHYLRSGYRDDVWGPGSPMEGDPSGEWGVHAFKEAGDDVIRAIIDYGPSGMIEAMRRMDMIWDTGSRRPSTAIGVAVGTVRLYGTVIEHERGYRAQYAMIDSIDRIEDCRRTGADRDNLLAALRTRYLPAQTP